MIKIFGLLVGLSLWISLGVEGPLSVGATSSPSPTPPTTPSLIVSQDQLQLAELEVIKQQLGSNIASAMQAQDQLAQSLKANRLQQDLYSQQIASLDSQIASLDSKIQADQADIIQTQDRINSSREALRALARTISDEPDSILLGLASSSSLSDFLTHISDLSLAGSRAQDIKQSLDSDEQKLQGDENDLQQSQSQAENKLTQVTDAQAKLQQLAMEQEVYIQQLDRQIAANLQELSSANHQSLALAQSIADELLRQQEEIISSAYSSIWAQAVAINPGTYPVSPSHSRKYRFIWPLTSGIITQGFGPSSLVLEPPYGNYPHFHTGIDLAAPLGSPVLAADDGVVVASTAMKINGQLAGYGNYVILAHAGGLLTLYGHLEKNLVKVGDLVTQGQIIGLEGSTGNSTGPHVHFELRINGQPQDPTPYLPPGGPSPLKQ